MTPQQKEQIEKAAKQRFYSSRDHFPIGAKRMGFIEGAKAVIEHPQKYDLCDKLKQIQAEQMSKDNLRLIMENNRYKEALERIANTPTIDVKMYPFNWAYEFHNIANSALKGDNE